MTDEDLKALIANLAIENEKTAQQMRETGRQMQKTDRQMQETDRRIQETDRQMQETSRQIQENDKRLTAQLANLNKLVDDLIHNQKDTSEIRRSTDERLERIGKLVGGMSNNLGEVTEEFFFNSLAKDNHLGEIRFDDITKNMEKRRGNIEEEYDLFLTNGDAVAVVEVKYKLHENDLTRLERKMQNFKHLFPIYKGHKLYGAVASFHVNPEAKEAALQKGYFVLQRCGDVIQTEARNVKCY